MTVARRAYDAQSWRDARRVRMSAARHNQEHCCRCGGEIDYSLPSNDRMGATCDHLESLALGGDIAPAFELLAPAHRACNSRHGSGLGHGIKSAKRNSKTITESNGKSDRILSAVSSSPPRKARELHSKRALLPPVMLNPYSPPRILSPLPENAVDTLARTWIPWIESSGGPGIKLREWQRVVLERALAVDADGRLVFRNIVVSTPRQSGKGWLAYALAAARCHFARQFDGPQTVVHVANNLGAARRIQSLSWRWAGQVGLDVRRGVGVERVIWPDGSSWDLSSANSVWGASASVAVADECWDLAPEVVTSALQPTMVERAESQLWLTSTANEGTTALMPEFRRQAIAGQSRTMIAEWSLAPEEDPLDPAVWPKASPHWSRDRAEMMMSARSTSGFRFQWLNQWPDVIAGEAPWLPHWDALGRADGDPRGGVGAIEASLDRALYGVSVAVLRGDGTLDVWAATLHDLQSAVDWLAEREPSVVLAGISLRDQVQLPVEVLPAGIKETRYSTPALQELVRRRAIRHDHDAGVLEQLGRSRITKTEQGDMLSAKASRGPIATLKAVGWASWHAYVAPVLEAPAVL